MNHCSKCCGTTFLVRVFVCFLLLLVVYRQLKASWDSRVEAIAALEAEMGRVRSSFEERERALEGEKASAEEHAR